MADREICDWGSASSHCAVPRTKRGIRRATIYFATAIYGRVRSPGRQFADYLEGNYLDENSNRLAIRVQPFCDRFRRYDSRWND